MSKWLVSIVNRPVPASSSLSCDGVRHAREEALLSLWNEIITPVDHSSNGDYEDFFEQAFRLRCALDSFGKDNIFLVTNFALQEAQHLGTGIKYPLKDLLSLPRYGSQPENAFLPGDNPQYGAENYFSDASFLDHASRVLVRCGFELSNGVDIVDAVQSMISSGHSRFFIKTAAPKKGTWDIDMRNECDDPQMLTKDQVQSILLDHLDWSLIRYEGIKDAFVVQSWVPMSYEYRLFVVNHEVVTGAGCIEEFTPLDNIARFDPQVRKNRHAHRDSSPKAQYAITCEPERVETLVSFGRTVATQHAQERPQVSEYTLDVAFNDQDRPLVIERNGLLNSGLYASQPWEVTNALHAAH